MADRLEQPDEQDQSEVFDETHLDDEGDGELGLDEMDDVLDVTQIDGDADEEILEVEDVQALDGVEADGREAPAPQDEPSDGDDADDQAASDEIELVYSGLMRNARGAQGSTAHWEARRLDDDDIDALGYAPDADTPQEDVP